MARSTRRLRVLACHTAAATAEAQLRDEVARLQAEVRRLRQSGGDGWALSGASRELGEVGDCSLDADVFRANRLSDAERAAFDRDGVRPSTDPLPPAHPLTPPHPGAPGSSSW